MLGDQPPRDPEARDAGETRGGGQQETEGEGPGDKKLEHMSMRYPHTGRASMKCLLPDKLGPSAAS